MRKNEQSLRDPWGTSKCNNTLTMGVPEEEGETGTERIFEETIARTPPNDEIHESTPFAEIQESQQMPSK